ncbi:unnamed protein product, partial [methanotrophic bacterial endosymbiont of Bathymodiolus sp.]
PKSKLSHKPPMIATELDLPL